MGRSQEIALKKRGRSSFLLTRPASAGNVCVCHARHVEPLVKKERRRSSIPRIGKNKRAQLDSRDRSYVSLFGLIRLRRVGEVQAVVGSGATMVRSAGHARFQVEDHRPQALDFAAFDHFERLQAVEGRVRCLQPITGSIRATASARRSCKRSICRMRRRPGSLIACPFSQSAMARSENPVSRENVFRGRRNFARSASEARRDLQPTAGSRPRGPSEGRPGQRHAAGPGRWWPGCADARCRESGRTSPPAGPGASPARLPTGPRPSPRP